MGAFELLTHMQIAFISLFKGIQYCEGSMFLWIILNVQTISNNERVPFEFPILNGNSTIT